MLNIVNTPWWCLEIKSNVRPGISELRGVCQIDGYGETHITLHIVSLHCTAECTAAVGRPALQCTLCCLTTVSLCDSLPQCRYWDSTHNNSAETHISTISHTHTRSLLLKSVYQWPKWSVNKISASSKHTKVSIKVKKHYTVCESWTRAVTLLPVWILLVVVWRAAMGCCWGYRDWAR